MAPRNDILERLGAQLIAPLPISSITCSRRLYLHLIFKALDLSAEITQLFVDPLVSTFDLADITNA